MIKSRFPLFTPRNICCGYLLESPQRGDSNKYPKHMFLGVLNTIFLNIPNYLPHLELRNRSILIVLITNFVVISNVSIKRVDCNSLFRGGNSVNFFFFPSEKGAVLEQSKQIVTKVSYGNGGKFTKCITCLYGTCNIRCHNEIFALWSNT